MSLCESIGRLTTTAARGLACAFLLAACQAVPHPFAPDPTAPDNPLLAVPDYAGIVVVGIDGVPADTARAATAAMVTALHRRNVPAAANGGNRVSFRLRGSAATRRTKAGALQTSLAWTLSDAKGRRVGGHTARDTAPSGKNGAPRREVIVRLAGESAAAIARLIQRTEPLDRLEAAKNQSLHVWRVTGAPGDGNKILRNALTGALYQVGLKVVPHAGEGALLIFGSMALAPPEGSKRQVEVVWTVRAPDGSELGKLEQRNMVSTSAFDGDWSDLAETIADNAAGGIADLLQRLPARPAAVTTGTGP